MALNQRTPNIQKKYSSSRSTATTNRTMSTTFWRSRSNPSSRRVWQSGAQYTAPIIKPLGKSGRNTSTSSMTSSTKFKETVFGRTRTWPIILYHSRRGDHSRSPSRLHTIEKSRFLLELQNMLGFLQPLKSRRLDERRSTKTWRRWE